MVHHRRSGLSSAYAPICYSFARILILAFVATLAASIGAPQVAADAGIVLNESLDTSAARITGSGHSAIYLSRICPDDSPTKMRMCRPGEQGSVLSNYTTFDESRPYEWNIVPLSIYLYGVEDPRNRPMVSSKEIKAALEERYREKYLSAICGGMACVSSSSAEWRQMVGATLERSLYLFVVKTSVEQDRALVAEFNALPNVNHFNPLTRNCADFARRVMNAYFPHAVSPDYINDFFITTPKAITHSLTRYAAQHPELDLRVLHFTQVPGTIKRSYECRSGTEQIYHSKKFLIPLGVFAWQGIPAAFSTYVLTGRFNPEHQFEAHASMDAADSEDSSYDSSSDITPAEAQAMAARTETISAQQADPIEDATDLGPAVLNDNSARDAGTIQTSKYVISVNELAAEYRNENRLIVGTKDEWSTYREQFPALVDDAVSQEIIPDRGYLKRVFKHVGDAASLTINDDGTLWMSIPNGETAQKVGLSASNIFAQGSNSRFAYQIILARMASELKSPKHSRETMLEFKNDWTLLEAAHKKDVAFASAAYQRVGLVARP